MSTHPPQEVTYLDRSAELHISSGRTAAVNACRSEVADDRCTLELFVEVQVDGQSVKLPWSMVVESLSEPIAVDCGALKVHFTAEDRYVFEVAGWEILSSHGIIPRAWKD